jgi:hypothetical protein
MIAIMAGRPLRCPRRAASEEVGALRRPNGRSRGARKGVEGRPISATSFAVFVNMLMMAAMARRPFAISAASLVVFAARCEEVCTLKPNTRLWKNMLMIDAMARRPFAISAASFVVFAARSEEACALKPNTRLWNNMLTMAAMARRPFAIPAASFVVFAARSEEVCTLKPKTRLWNKC